MSDTGARRRRVQAEDLPYLNEVLLHRKHLSRPMNAHDATRLVLGLLFLSRKAHAAPGTGVPTWSWLMSQSAAGDSGIRAAVSKCLAHWLPTTDAQGTDTGTRTLMPIPPPRSDEHLRALIQAIGSTQRVGPLLDQCLRDLSADQADGSRYFTPIDMARLMVGAAVPRDRHRVLDPVCGSGGLLVESHRYVHDRVEADPAMSLQGKEQHADTSQVARMNFAVRGINADVSPPGDSLAEPEHEPYDIILANLPFNQRDWAPEHQTKRSASRSASRVPTDPRWPAEPPSRGSANPAWIQHIAHALAPAGRAAFLMADNVANTQQLITRRLRERLLREDLVECVIALPPRVFGHTETTACLWVLNKDKSARSGWGVRDRRRQVLFINARRAFELVPRSRARRLGEKNAALVLETLAAWRGLYEDGVAVTPYQDETGWSRSCSIKEIADHEYSLMPTSYAVEPPSPERDTRSQIDELKLELADSFDRMRDLELRLLKVLEEI